MKRLMLAVGLAAFAAAPAAAQLIGLPVWNSPKGGTGITVSGDFGLPNEDYGKGTAFGARGALGLGNLTVTAGMSSWKPDGASESYTSVGGNAAFRVIGGSLLPVAINLQLGYARIGEANTQPTLTRIVAGGGVSASLPTPGISIEPYVSVTNRWRTSSGLDAESNMGWTLGANANFGVFGFHAAYDSESQEAGGTAGVLGIGAHIQLRAPIGL
jgi:hypothetical protein